jgi:peroxin-11B
MRLGKPMEHLQAALRALHNASHNPEQVTTVGKQLCYCGYLVYDTFIWVSSYICQQILCIDLVVFTRQMP